jgi:cell division control protein 45
MKETSDEDGTLEGEEWVGRFWDAYDALEKYAFLNISGFIGD